MAREASSAKVARPAKSRKALKRRSPVKKPAAMKSALSHPPVATIRCEDTLAAALAVLRARDPSLIDEMLALAGPPPLRLRSPDLAGLAWIVVGQQVSTASAKAIYTRFAAGFPGFDAKMLTTASDETLRACGLSSPKMRTMRAIAAAIVSGELNFKTLAQLPAGQAHAALTALHGIGPWTADIFLLFCLGHPDAWPAGDLALQEAARMVLKLRKRPDAKQLEKIAERWRPARGVAARLLWSWYGAAKKPAAGAATGTLRRN